MTYIPYPITLQLGKERNDEYVELPKSNYIHLYTTPESDPIKGIFMKFNLDGNPINLALFNPIYRPRASFNGIYLTHPIKNGMLCIVCKLCEEDGWPTIEERLARIEKHLGIKEAP